jgi:hypothetical protein
MQATASLYLPVAEVDLRDVFPGAQLAGGLFARGSAFRVPFKDGSVRFNIMPAAQVARHLAQFVAYIESLEESEAAKETAARAVEATKTVLGLQTDLEFEGNEELAIFWRRSMITTKGASSCLTAWCFMGARCSSVRSRKLPLNKPMHATCETHARDGRR